MLVANAAIKKKKKKRKKGEKDNATSSTELVSQPVQTPMTGCPG